jgi:protocatechuate 3,4-dioxygenase beta subunit
VTAPDPEEAHPHHPRILSLSRRLSRRTLFGLAGVTVASALVGCGPGDSMPPWLLRLFPRRPSSAESFPPCIVRPEQTEGPYFVDERLNRSDIRTDPSDGSMKEGMPLHLTLRVHGILGRECAPLPGVLVDLWQCDASGVYSDVRERAFDTRGKQFLRGYQTTDGHGTVAFETIYPGWYPGRTVHIHFKLRSIAPAGPAARRGLEFTSQIYFDDTLTARIHAQAPYTAKGIGRIRNQDDGIFLDGGEELILPLPPGRLATRGRLTSACC